MSGADRPAPSGAVRESEKSWRGRGKRNKLGLHFREPRASSHPNQRATKVLKLPMVRPHFPLAPATSLLLSVLRSQWPPGIPHTCTLGPLHSALTSTANNLTHSRFDSFLALASTPFLAPLSPTYHLPLNTSFELFHYLTSLEYIGHGSRQLVYLFKHRQTPRKHK